jgi:hypothetical protein
MASTTRAQVIRQISDGTAALQRERDVTKDAKEVRCLPPMTASETPLPSLPEDQMLPGFLGVLRSRFRRLG